MLTQDQAQAILQSDLKNLVKKVADGGNLSTKEREFVAKHLDTESEASNISELCKIVGISRPTFYKYKELAGAPKNLGIDEWMAFVDERDAIQGKTSNRVLVGGKHFTPQDIIDLKALESQERHKRLHAERKLKEIELKKVEQNWVPITEAKKVISEITTMMARLLDNFPKRYATRVDPTNPEEAEEILRECIDELQTQMNTEPASHG